MIPSVDLDIDDLTRTADPYALLRRIREVGPVAQMPSGLTITTGHAECLAVLRDPAAMSGPISAHYHQSLPPGAAHDELVHRINFLDPPDHPRVRGIVSKAFTPRRVSDIRPFVASSGHAIADDLGDRFDLLADFAHHVPSLVISEMLGVPAGDRDRLTAWSDEVTPLLGWRVTAEERAGAIEAAESFHAYLGALLDERATAPADDLLSALLLAEEDGDRLSRAELLSLAATLYSAGHRTTRDLTTNGLSVLLSDPARWAHFVAHPEEVGAHVAEFLRYETPTLFIARVPAAPIEIGDVEIPESTPVIVAIGGANRDPAVYADAETFDPARFGAEQSGRTAPPSPLSFAFGAHFCLGASLARTEAEVMLATVVERWPTLRLAPDTDLEWRQRGPFRSLAALPVEVA